MVGRFFSGLFVLILLLAIIAGASAGKVAKERVASATVPPAPTATTAPPAMTGVYW